MCGGGSRVLEIHEQVVLVGIHAVNFAGVDDVGKVDAKSACMTLFSGTWRALTFSALTRRRPSELTVRVPEVSKEMSPLLRQLLPLMMS